jgi:aspartyl protease family protein
MSVPSRTGRALREAVLWVVVIGAGYASFRNFEGAFDTAKAFFAKGSAPQSAREGEARPPASPLALAGFRIDSAAQALRGSITQPLALRPSGGKRQVTIEANAYGHFHVDAQVAGKPVEFMTDTGATYVALSYETALGLGIKPASLRFDGRSTTANGVARVASITLDAVRIGDIVVRDVQAVVAEPGRMAQNLLGMSFIGRLSGFDLSGTRLVMTE